MNRKPLYIVGAGPGKKEFLSLRAFELVQKADVIIFDYLVDQSILEINARAEKVCFRGNAAEKQRALFEFIKERYSGKDLMIRLKGGEPFIFSRLGEEIDFLKDNNIDFEIIPGLTAAIGAASELQLPLTLRGSSAGLLILTGKEARNDGARVDWKKIAAVLDFVTVAIYMAQATIGEISDKLISNGVEPDTPVIIVRNAMRNEHKEFVSNLGHIKEDIRNIPAPVIILLGGAVNTRVSKILFTGTDHQRYRHLGRIVPFPLLQFKKAAAIRKPDIEKIDGIIFTSPRAVKFFFEDIDPEGVRRKNIYAVGAVTAASLAELGVKPDITAFGNSSESLINAIDGEVVAGKRFFYPTSNLSANKIADIITRRGAIVHKVILYETVKNNQGRADLTDVDAVFFTSPSTVKFFKEDNGIPRNRIRYMAIGAATKEYAEKEGYENVSIAAAYKI